MTCGILRPVQPHAPLNLHSSAAVGSSAPPQPAHPNDKMVTFIRHGKSAGNAGVKGVVEMGSLTAYRDGYLVTKGEQQVMRRAETIDLSLMHRICSAEVVLVSPLARAMATAVIFLAEAHHRMHQIDGKTPKSWPRVEVITELREKVKSASDRPGRGEDPLLYVRTIAEKYSAKAFGHSDALQSVVEDICRSYEYERGVTNGWKAEPEDVVSYHNMIRRFKERLRRRPETNIILVGHSGWARFAFSSLMPAAGEENRMMNLITGAREIHSLCNAGVILSRFSYPESRFRDLDVLAEGSAPSLDTEEESKGIISSPREAIASKVIPIDGDFHRMVLSKMAEYTGHWEVRVFMFSSTGGQAFLSWATKWGEPKDFIELGKETKITKVTEEVLMVSAVHVHRPFKVRARTPEDFETFVYLFGMYRCRALQKLDGSERGASSS